ncbi:MAG: DUF3419 family protein [Thiolinea sp.]
MTGASQALKLAVQQYSAASLQGMQQKLFRIWFNSFIYNQIWEDPVVDMEALQLQPESQVLTIASGGCNTLSYLTASPARIVALDLNPYHLALTRLKIAALQYLPGHAAFYDFFGHADRVENIEHYELYIRPHLSDEDIDFWAGRSLTGQRRIHLFRDDLYRHTRFGYFMRFLHWLGRRSGHDPAQLLQAQSLEQQRAIFEQHIRPFFDNRVVRLLGKLPMSVFSLGIPPQQYQAMQQQGNLIGQYCERVERLACQFPVQDNYFAWQGFGHRYDHERRQAIPAYLTAENYQLIRSQLHKLETVENNLISYLRTQADNTLDRFVFLDAQDWMSDEVLQQLWEQVDRVGKPGSRIIFRTAAAESPLEQALSPELRARFSYDPQQSQAWFRRDRSAIYGGFHLYCKAE